MILWKTDFTDATGLTVVTTTGTVTFNQTVDGKKCVLLDTTSEAWPGIGWYTNSGIASGSGHTLFISVRTTGWANITNGFTDAAQMGSYDKNLGWTIGSSKIKGHHWGNPSYGDMVHNESIWENVKVVIGSDNASASWRVDGGGAWTDLGTSNNNGPDWSTGIDAYFQTSCYSDTGKVLTLADCAYTDDGTFTPPAPTTLAGSGISKTEIDLTWSDGTINSVNSDDLSLERSATGGGAGFSEIATPSIGDEAYSDSGLTENTSYFYRARAKITWEGADHYSAYTSEVEIATPGGDDTAAEFYMQYGE